MQSHHQPPNPPLLVALPTKDDLVHDVAAFVARAQKESIDKKGRFTIAVSGGSLPNMLKGLIHNPHIKWNQWQVYYVDERVVPLDHPDSNHRACTEALFSKVPIPKEHIHTIDTALLNELEELADAYEKQLIHEFAQKDAARFPVFDLILLGMGPDGHTASLFPGHELLAEEDRWVAYLDDSPKPPPRRIPSPTPLSTTPRVSRSSLRARRRRICSRAYSTTPRRDCPQRVCALSSQASCTGLSTRRQRAKPSIRALDSSSERSWSL
ncbi:glucosamine-6-phosphate isomerases/6-phosphogluconolactonase-domain-containing protein [Pholiota molesta]|nr:glucosamine-6-phosphate isomerases/6-phosphogluconolactonase-domain-containing protein [Pholiota molesta]